MSTLETDTNPSFETKDLDDDREPQAIEREIDATRADMRQRSRRSNGGSRSTGSSTSPSGASASAVESRRQLDETLQPKIPCRCCSSPSAWRGSC